MAKYYSVGIHVDATGFALVKAPDEATEDEIKDFVRDEFFPTVENTELGDPIEVVSVSEMTEEEFEETNHRHFEDVMEYE